MALAVDIMDENGLSNKACYKHQPKEISQPCISHSFCKRRCGDDSGLVARWSTSL